MSGEGHCELSRNAIFLNGLEYILLLLTLLNYPGFNRPALASPLDTLGFPFWTALQVVPSNGVIPSVEL